MYSRGEGEEEEKDGGGPLDGVVWCVLRLLRMVLKCLCWDCKYMCVARRDLWRKVGGL